MVDAIGDEVNGTNFGGDLSVETIFATREALVEYGVIFSHDQDFEFAAHNKVYLDILLKSVFIHFCTQGGNLEFFHA